VERTVYDWFCVGKAPDGRIVLCEQWHGCPDTAFIFGLGTDAEGGLVVSSWFGAGCTRERAQRFIEDAKEVRRLRRASEASHGA
jgi:hypothetical protein